MTPQPTLQRIDFSDCFAATNHQDSITDVAMQLFGTAPKWVDWLFKLRNAIVTPFGLKHTMPDERMKVEIGGHIGFFEILQIMETELILGVNDSHLNFRVHILNNLEPKDNIQVTTLVEIKNWFGRLYFLFVRPIHPLVVKAMLRKVNK